MESSISVVKQKGSDVRIILISATGIDAQGLARSYIEENLKSNSSSWHAIKESQARVLPPLSFVAQRRAGYPG